MRGGGIGSWSVEAEMDVVCDVEMSERALFRTWCFP